MASTSGVKRGNNLLHINSVPTGALAITVAASWLGMVITIVLQYPLVVIGIVTLIPWLPLFFSEATWKYRHYAWFALIELLVIVQGLHFIEHIAQITEVDMLHLPRSQARGIFGNLDQEYVQCFFESFLTLGVIALLLRFRDTIALWVCLVIGLWQSIEQWYITYYYTFDRSAYLAGKSNGLLARGGLLWPNSPLPRIELNFLYNLLFTIPLIYALVLILRDAYDEYLKKAFPRLSEAQLASINSKLESLHASAGDVILRQGDPADRFYILAGGEVDIIQELGGQPVVINHLTAGQFFGEVGLLAGTPRNASVRAATNCDLLALDRETFLAVMGNSLPTAQEYAEIVTQRGGPPLPVLTAAGSGSQTAQGNPLPAGEPIAQPNVPWPTSAGVPPAVSTLHAPVAPPPQPAMQIFSTPAPAAAYPEHQTGPTSVAPAAPVAGQRPGALPGPGAQLPFERPTDPVSTPFPLRRRKQPQPSERPTDPGSNLFTRRLSQVLNVLAGSSDTPIIESGSPEVGPASDSWAYGIIFVQGEQSGRGIVLNTERLQIGRDLSNELRLARDPLVSRRHAELLRTQTGGYQIRDLGSSNGISVNNERLARGEIRELKEDDEVRIGNSVFALRRVGARVV
jgi:hypothetical protein